MNGMETGRQPEGIADQIRSSITASVGLDADEIIEAREMRGALPKLSAASRDQFDKLADKIKHLSSELDVHPHDEIDIEEMTYAGRTLAGYLDEFLVLAKGMARAQYQYGISADAPKAEPNHTVGQVIREARALATLTQEEFAERLSIGSPKACDRVTVIDWEKDRTVPSLKSIRKISRALSIPLEKLIQTAKKTKKPHKSHVKPY
jgi:DNA-binding XRE family transcriptional regulator